MKIDELTDDHPFVIWWINESGWHARGNDWRAELCLAEGVLAFQAWFAARAQPIQILSDVTDISDVYCDGANSLRFLHHPYSD